MSFENIDIENINHCPEIDFISGLKTRLYFAPASYFFFTPLPKPAGSFESEIVISDDILMRKNKLLRYIDILVDENELKISLNGSKQKKRTITNLTVFILGFTPSVLGFVQRCKNVPLIFFIQDANGNNWQIGHSVNRAFMETADISSGKKYEDNSGAAVALNCNSSVFLYQKPLDHFSKPGDFNNDFNNDFFKKYD
ncbi:hypothetical protein [Chryseobacterium sp. ZHDP1]|uniref:hypothetical protein n=1 Tax=Chryseobacterium sp. ZHDP1 TaxID=2838877 RepID=UPI001BE01346|nr:hypothetical protein [Chryseobacterium sp. ZHDP1]QWA38876.1 hypothetical protein KKI44_01305 [Chryseobacterium sp. ZHDP1]